MNYKLELNTQEPGSNIVFNSIVLDSFKVNIVEKYVGKNKYNLKLFEVLFKVRTLDDILIQKKDGNLRVKIKNEDFVTYQKLRNVLSSYDYKNKLISRKDADQDYAYFILKLVISNYDLN